MSMFTTKIESKIPITTSDKTEESTAETHVDHNACKTLKELAANSLATGVAGFLKTSESIEENDEAREVIKSIEDDVCETKDVLALVVVLDNTASQSSSWQLITNTFSNLLPFLDSRHGEDQLFSITYEIRMIFANDYTSDHLNAAAASERIKEKYIADPKISVGKSTPVIGELCRISSDSSQKEKNEFLEYISNMKCYGGADGAEAYAPALELASKHTKELVHKYGNKAVVATIFCGDDIPHGCSSQSNSSRDNWPDGDPSGLNWFEVISNYPTPIHCLSPPHSDEDSRCCLGYAVRKTGGFHLVVDENSSTVLLRLLMAEMKLSWLIERNIKDMESATPQEISEKIAGIINKESFDKPSNTVPVDPRIEKIDEVIQNTGFKPYLMRTASDQVPRSAYTRCMKSASTIEKGVSNSGVMRALRTATGGSMRPNLMRMVSNTVTPIIDDEVIEPTIHPPLLHRC